ncbi:MAG: type II secretion system protein GspG [Deltaproteobacteria bacterium]|nr:MAG: type II secretion system protein GspG [Deltaproteobacteria bacterium]
MTLIEIMVVVLILGMIASLVGVKVFGIFQKSQRDAVKVQMNTFKGALDLFKLNCGFYPSTEQGLEALLSPPSVGRQCKNFTPGGYIESIPLDPWGNPYVYIAGSGGAPYDIISYGADGVEGGEGEDADIHLSDFRE